MTVFASGRGSICAVKGGGGGGGGTTNTPVILGSVTSHGDTTADHSSSNANHTVTAGTELLLAVTFWARDAGGTPVENAPSSDVNGAFTEIVAANIDGSTGQTNMPAIGLWYLAAPTSGAHVITRSRTATGVNGDWSGICLINLDVVDVADPIGAFKSVTEGASNTFADSITTEKTVSLIVAAGSWQGVDALPINEDLGLTQRAEFDSGGGTNANDGAMSVATKTGPSTPGTATFGFTASVSDDVWGAAVEIRGLTT